MPHFINRRHIVLVTAPVGISGSAIGSAVGRAIQESVYRDIAVLIDQRPSRGILVLKPGEDRRLIEARLHQAGYSTSSIDIDSDLLREG